MLSFRGFAVRMTGTNSAFSYNLKNAITGTYPDYLVDYSLALVSRGDMPNALNPAAVAGTAGRHPDPDYRHRSQAKHAGAGCADCCHRYNSPARRVQKVLPVPR